MNFSIGPCYDSGFQNTISMWLQDLNEYFLSHCIIKLNRILLFDALHIGMISSDCLCLHCF